MSIADIEKNAVLIKDNDGAFYILVEGGLFSRAPGSEWVRHSVSNLRERFGIKQYLNYDGEWITPPRDLKVGDVLDGPDEFDRLPKGSVIREVGFQCLWNKRDDGWYSWNNVGPLWDSLKSSRQFEVQYIPS